MAKDTILTGLRANNDLHLGNYLGALLPMVKLQQKYAGEYQINLFVPDLHSFTTEIDHSRLYSQTMRNLKLFVAVGLDLNNQDTYLYRQSFVKAHSELTVILNSFTYIGELFRMTQFKEKAMSLVAGEQPSDAKVKMLLDQPSQQASISAGLFNYPVLMAADILLYGAKYVPVGEDQTQHVELARDIGERMNNRFGQDLFTLPAPEKDQVAFAQQTKRVRIRDLADPSKKMSKSEASDKGVIFLSDDPEAAVRKIISATTDSENNVNYDYKKQPGVSNLIEILAALTNQSVENVRKQYEGQTEYGHLKQAAAEAVKQFLTDIQFKLANVDEQALNSKLETSEKAMNEIANEALKRVQIAVGLRQK